MKISHRIDDQICIVSIDGELANTEVDEINIYVEPLVQNEAIEAMIMDLDQVAFIDSSGLSFLVATYEALKQRKVKFAVYHLTRKNEEIFRLTHIDQFLDVYPTKAEAIAHL